MWAPPVFTYMGLKRDLNGLYMASSWAAYVAYVVSDGVSEWAVVCRNHVCATCLYKLELGSEWARVQLGTFQTHVDPT